MESIQRNYVQGNHLDDAMKNLRFELHNFRFEGDD
jgi:hypothetical protein